MKTDEKDAKAAVEKIEALTAEVEVGRIYEGKVARIVDFGAFVNVLPGKDGLVHISAITNKFISDPREVVKAGDIVKVKVLEVDVARKRISFTMRLDDDVPQAAPQGKAASNKPSQNKTANKQAKGQRPKKDAGNAAMGNAFAEAFAKLKK